MLPRMKRHFGYFVPISWAASSLARRHHVVTESLTGRIFCTSGSSSTILSARAARGPAAANWISEPPTIEQSAARIIKILRAIRLNEVLHAEEDLATNSAITSL
jgi:hypothetical protein